MKKFNYKSPIFKKYIMSYLIVIFVMTLIMSTWSIGNYKKYKRENIKNAEIAAENFGKNFDNMLRTLYYNTDKLTTSKQFSDARIYKNSDKLLEFQKEVKRALYPFTQAEFMAVYFNSRGLYVANGVYSKEDFYGSNFKYGDKTAEEWNAEVIESTDSIKFLPAEYVKYNNMRNKMLPIILSLNNSKIISLVSPEKFDINGYEYSIVTKNGNVVYSELDNYIFPEKSFSEKGWYFANVNGKKNFFVSYPSEFTGITYILSAKKSQVLSSALIYRDTAVVIMLLSLFAAIALALYLSVVNVNPIYQFLNKIKDNMMLEEDDALELDSVGTSILKLVESNENLSKQLDKRFQHMRENFLYRVINGAFDTNEQAEKNIDLITDDIRNENRPVAFFEKTSELYNQMCSAVNMSAKGKNLKLKDKIEEYLDNNFQNTEMNLYMISKEFNFSESYFSRIFKEIFDCNFSYYLEQKRISKAIEILKTQNYKINEITFMVGYSSAQVMRRAFKRITGITPDEYRKSQE